MSDQPTGKNVSRGLAWVGTASSLVGVLDFLAILIVLGVWVPADQYGVATMAVWIFPILDQATDLGLSAAVVQREQHDEDTISTVFWINLTSALVLFAVLCLGAPILAREFYGHDVVGWMLIAYGTKLVWQNVYFIPSAMMRRQLRFKELSVIRIIANVAEFCGKVGFAAAGFGIWCFVLGPLCRVLVTGIGCQLRHPWRPRFVLRLRQAWSYASFGAKSAGSQILFYFYTNVDYPVVGYYFGETALGLYRIAYEIVLEPVRVISHVVVDVAFPVFARLRNLRDQLIEKFVLFTRLNLVTVMTYAAIVFVVSDDLIALAFSDYIGAENAVRILCFVAVLRSVSFVVPPLLDGVGRPLRTFVYTLTAAVALPVSFVVAANVLPGLSYLSVAVAWAVGYPIAFAVLILLAVSVLDLPVLRFVRQVSGVPLCAVAAVGIGEIVHWLGRPLPVAVRLVVTIAVMVAVLAALLAYTQGLSVNAALRSLKDDKAAAQP